MKKIIYEFFLLVIFLFIVIPNVLAEETTTTIDTTCNYNSQAYLNRVASNVRASYAFHYDENNNVSFDITVYNITEDIYVVVNEKGGDKRNAREIFYAMTDNGSYTFNVADIDNVITYEITVRPTVFGCVNDIRKLNVTKPKHNKFSDEDICQYDEVLDYFYCQEWVTQDFSMSDSAVREKIIAERNNYRKTSQTRCISCEIEEEATTKRNAFNKLKLYAIIGLSLGIVIDIAIIIVLLRKIRRYSVYE